MFTYLTLFAGFLALLYYTRREFIHPDQAEDPEFWKRKKMWDDYEKNKANEGREIERIRARKAAEERAAKKSKKSEKFGKILHPNSKKGRVLINEPVEEFTKDDAREQVRSEIDPSKPQDIPEILFYKLFPDFINGIRLEDTEIFEYKNSDQYYKDRRKHYKGRELPPGLKRRKHPNSRRLHKRQEHLQIDIVFLLCILLFLVKVVCASWNYLT
jgi:hypothetical protein